MQPYDYTSYQLTNRVELVHFVALMYIVLKTIMNHREGLTGSSCWTASLLFRDELAFFRQQRRSMMTSEVPMAQRHSPAPGQNSGSSRVSEDVILKIAKEIAIKFIEVGRLTPATFDETFKNIHQTIKETISTDD